MAIATSQAVARNDLAFAFQEFDLEAAAAGYAAQAILPTVEVAQQSGSFYIVPVETLKQSDRNTDRSRDGSYSRGHERLSQSTYATIERGYEERIDERESNVFAGLDLEMLATGRTRQTMMDAKEKRVATLVFNTSTWTGASLTTGVSVEWDTVATADPIKDVAGAVLKIKQNSGLRANAAIMSESVYNNLRRCEKILDRIKGGATSNDPAIAEQQVIARILGLDRLIVAGAVKNTANFAVAAAIAEVWDDEYCMVCKVAISSDPREPCIGRTFHWGSDGSQIGGLIEQYYLEETRGNIIRCREDAVEKILLPEAGHLLSNITT